MKVKQNRLSREKTELFIGFILMFTSWFLVLLIAIDYIIISDPRFKIAVLITLYAVSLMGLILSTYGLFGIYTLKMRERERDLDITIT